MTTARFKPATRYRNLVSTVKYRILCGKTDERGCHNCRGELGHVFPRLQKFKQLDGQQCLLLDPLVNSAMARDKASGAYRLTGQRRQFLSGSEGSRHVGGGVARAGGANLVRDAQGQPLKWLDPMYDHPRHDRIVIVCPRCSTSNEITYGDFVAYVERTFAPL